MKAEITLDENEIKEAIVQLEYNAGYSDLREYQAPYVTATVNATKH